MQYSTVRLERLSLDKLYDSMDFKVDLVTTPPEIIDRITVSKFRNKVVPMAPQCMCGSIHGSANVDTICLDCGTPVLNYLGDYRPVVWISAVGDVRFIAPQFWKMLDNLITESDKIDTLAWLTNTRYRSMQGPSIALQNMVTEIPGFKRSYTWFANNLRLVLEYLYNANAFSTKRDRIKTLIHIYDTMPETIYSKHIPLPNKDLFLIENSSFGKEKAGLTTGQLKSLAINYIDAIESGRDSDASISRLISELSRLFMTNVTELLDGKKKVIRSNIFGTKIPGSFRTVMVPISGPHRYDDFIMPWVPALAVFRPLLMNRLVIRTNANYMDVSIKLDLALTTFDQDVYNALEEILEEAKVMTGGRGIPITMNRNPSQYRGSILMAYITKIKTDPFDFTSEYSPLMCNSVNGDFDGDNCRPYVVIHMENLSKCGNPLKISDTTYRFEKNYNTYGVMFPVGMVKTLMYDQICEMGNRRSEAS